MQLLDNVVHVVWKWDWAEDDDDDGEENNLDDPPATSDHVNHICTQVMRIPMMLVTQHRQHFLYHI